MRLRILIFAALFTFGISEQGFALYTCTIEYTSCYNQAVGTLYKRGPGCNGTSDIGLELPNTYYCTPHQGSSIKCDMNNGKGTGIGTGAGLNDYCMIPKNAFTYSNSAWTWNTERDAWHSARKPTTKTNYDWVPTPNDPIMGKGTGENDTLFNLWKKIHYEGCGDTYCEDLDTCKRIHAIGGESTLRWFMYGTTCTGASEKKSETSYYCKVKANGQCSQTKCETDVKPVDFFKISGSNPHQNVVDGNVHTASLNPCMPPLIKGSDGKPDMEASIAEWEAQAILYSDENGTTAASTWLLQKIWEEVWENACMEDWTNDPTPYYKMNDVPSYKG